MILFSDAGRKSNVKVEWGNTGGESVKPEHKIVPHCRISEKSVLGVDSPSCGKMPFACHFLLVYLENPFFACRIRGVLLVRMLTFESESRWTN